MPHERHRIHRPAGAGDGHELHAGTQHHAGHRARGQPGPQARAALCLLGPDRLWCAPVRLRARVGRAAAGVAAAGLGREDRGRGLPAVAGLEAHANRPPRAGRRRAHERQLLAGRGPAVHEHQGLDAHAGHHRRLDSWTQQPYCALRRRAARAAGLYLRERPELRADGLAAARLAGRAARYRGAPALVQPRHGRRAGTDRRLDADGMNATSKGLWLGALGVLIFSLSLPMTRLAVGTPDAPQMSGVFIALGRAAVAAGLSAAFLLATRAPLPRRQDWWPLAITAGGVVFGFPLLSSIAMRYVQAVHSSVIVGVLPLATAAVGALLHRQRPSSGFWLCAAAGSALVVAFAMLHSGDASSAGAATVRWADALLLLAMLC